MNLSGYFIKKQNTVNEALKKLLPAQNTYPARIHQAMHYCMKAGKRVRAILCMAACKACNGNEKDALRTACAIEMLHTYSLLHDDLPAMDNSDYRRGRQSCHKQFDEATAVLAGDALITLAYKLLATATKSLPINIKILNEITDATGSCGMIGGQMVDIEVMKKKQQNPGAVVDIPTLEYITTHKTGMFIASACKIGAIIAKADKKQTQALLRYGEYIGFAFQIIDDILDNDGLVKVFGQKGAYQRAEILIEKAKQQITRLNGNKKPLIELADFILTRKK